MNRQCLFSPTNVVLEQNASKFRILDCEISFGMQIIRAWLFIFRGKLWVFAFRCAVGEAMARWRSRGIIFLGDVSGDATNIATRFTIQAYSAGDETLVA
jgi:TPP-dependent 2-oxoacid decarboxylase